MPDSVSPLDKDLKVKTAEIRSVRYFIIMSDDLTFAQAKETLLTRLIEHLEEESLQLVGTGIGVEPMFEIIREIVTPRTRVVLHAWATTKDVPSHIAQETKPQGHDSVISWIDGMTPWSPSSPASDSPATALTRMLPGLTTRVLCPATCNSAQYDIAWAIVHLNDTHKWTRESIADWLETLDVDLSFKGDTDDHQ